MKNVILKFEKILHENTSYFPSLEKECLEGKILGKWSKKEIIGHLVDSAIHNLVRFTEINYLKKPYHQRPYNQMDLVTINQYQTIDIKDLTQLWLSINQQIIRVMKIVDDKALNYEIVLNDSSVVDLKFLMTDYVDHLEHHIQQIRS